MSDSYRFFSNTKCEYFPCHKGVAEEEYNCLFCFCPLYFLENCGGRPGFTAQGIKDCSACTLPHAPGGYDKVMERLRAEFDRMRTARD